MADTFDQRLGFWENRSSLGFAAGSGDVNLKKLEINAIHQSIGDPASVLDAGCGNAFTLLELSLRHPTTRFYGFDYSKGMISSGHALIESNNLSQRVRLCRASLLDPLPSALAPLDFPDIGFDAVYTERSIINLDSLSDQCKAVQSLWSLVAPGGRLVLCEAFTDGLAEINFYRQSVNLEPIQSPWHNRYLSISEIGELLDDISIKYTINEFSGSYYFVSRVIHARDALANGAEPSYSAQINLQSLELASLPCCGQSKIVIFEKK